MENKEKNKYIGNAYNKLVEMLEEVKKENEEKDKTLEERQRFIDLEAKKLDQLNKAIYSLKKEVKEAYKLIKTQNIINLKISSSYLDDITKWKDACSRLSTRGINDMKYIDQLKMHHLSDDWAIKYHTLENENIKLKNQLKEFTHTDEYNLDNKTDSLYLLKRIKMNYNKELCDTCEFSKFIHMVGPIRFPKCTANQAQLDKKKCQLNDENEKK